MKKNDPVLLDPEDRARYEAEGWRWDHERGWHKPFVNRDLLKTLGLRAVYRDGVVTYEPHV